jgi:uncharacterized membrane protein
MEKSFSYKKLLQYFFQGLLILAPIAITIYSVVWLFTTIDSWIPIFSYRDENNISHVRNYGLGFIIILVAIVVLGYFSSFFITTRIVNFLDRLMQKMPGLKHIYGTARDFFEAFAGDKKKFTQNVLANVDDNNVWRIGFITKEDMTDFGLEGFVAVYVPTSYSVAGSVYIVPKERVKPITNINSAQSMKFAVSGGVTDVTEEQ